MAILIDKIYLVFLGEQLKKLSLVDFFMMITFLHGFSSHLQPSRYKKWMLALYMKQVHKLFHSISLLSFPWIFLGHASFVFLLC